MNRRPSSENLLTCPACGESLDWCGKACRCAQGHSFDLAKEGYVNLLLSHQRKSKNPGDDTGMIQARRRFFDSGAFDPLTELIIQTVPASAQRILDCGCGEGHFLGVLSETLTGRFFGMDVSKPAIQCAAKRYKKANWIIANAMRSIPFTDQSLNVILSILAPRNPEEFARILNPDGTLILGVPGPNHLIELRSRLAASAADYEEKSDEAAAKCVPHFVEQERKMLVYERRLSRNQLTDLIQMTPIFWCSSPEAKAEVQQLDGLDVTISFALLALHPA